MLKFRVYGWQKTISIVTVDASTEKEAVERAWNGEGDMDTEPEKNIERHKWRVEEMK